MTMSGSINPGRQQRQGRSTTPSSNGSVTSSWRTIQKGLQGVIREYLQAPLVSTLPQPAFLMAGPSQSNSSVQLEEGLCQMSDIVTVMLDKALLDQGSQGSKKSSQTIWKIVDQEEIATTSHWTEYEYNSDILYSWPANPS